jgi:hypothetical protein
MRLAYSSKTITSLWYGFLWYICQKWLVRHSISVAMLINYIKFIENDFNKLNIYVKKQTI